VWSVRRVSTMPASFPWSTTPPRSSAACWAKTEIQKAMIDDMNDPAPEQTPTDGEPQTRAEIAAAELATLLAKAEAELADTKDKLLRTLAESENQRRRLQRDREDAQKYAAANFAKELLDVADNLRRALASVEAGDLQDARAKSLIEG